MGRWDGWRLALLFIVGLLLGGLAIYVFEEDPPAARAVISLALGSAILRGREGILRTLRESRQIMVGYQTGPFVGGLDRLLVTVAGVGLATAGAMLLIAEVIGVDL